MWLIQSPIGVVYTVRGEAARQLCKEELLSYDTLAKHIGHKPLGPAEKATSRKAASVKGWCHLPRAQWLQAGLSYVCRSALMRNSSSR
jgi:hypothetical protein